MSDNVFTFCLISQPIKAYFDVFGPAQRPFQGAEHPRCGGLRNDCTDIVPAKKQGFPLIPSLAG